MNSSWGNIRRFPLPSERNRTGGAGIYYHVSLSHSAYFITETHWTLLKYDYVGDPRDYKWITVFGQNLL